MLGMMAPMSPNGAYSTRVSPWSPVQEVGTSISAGDLVGVAESVGGRRRPLGVHLRQRCVGTALPLLELRHHLAYDRLDAGVVQHQPTSPLEYVTAPPTSNVSTIATITPSQGRLSVTSVRRAELPVA